MIAYLRKNDGLLMFLAPVLLALVSIVANAFGTAFRPDVKYMPLVSQLAPLEFLEQWPWLNLLLMLPLVVLTMVFLNRVVQQLGLLSRLSNIPMLTLALVFLTTPASLNTPLLWVSILLVVPFLQQCGRILDSERVNDAVFGAAFLVGWLTLIYPFMLTFVIGIAGVTMISGNLTLRRIVLTLLGLSLPTYLTACLLYLIAPGKLHHLWQLFDFSLTSFSQPMTVHSLLLVAVVISIFISNATMLASTTLRERRKWQFELLLMLVALIAGLLGDPDFFIAASVVPGSILLARGLNVGINVWVARAVFYLLLTAATWNLFFGA